MCLHIRKLLLSLGQTIVVFLIVFDILYQYVIDEELRNQFRNKIFISHSEKWKIINYRVSHKKPSNSVIYIWLSWVRSTDIIIEWWILYFMLESISFQGHLPFLAVIYLFIKLTGIYIFSTFDRDFLCESTIYPSEL